MGLKCLYHIYHNLNQPSPIIGYIIANVGSHHALLLGDFIELGRQVGLEGEIIPLTLAQTSRLLDGDKMFIPIYYLPYNRKNFWINMQSRSWSNKTRCSYRIINTWGRSRWTDGNNASSNFNWR